MGDEEKRPPTVTLLSILMGLTALATAAFWVLFFSNKIEATETVQDDVFEKAFPVADSWMIATASVAAVNLVKMNKTGLLSGIAAGSAMIFLACMDILYSVENHKYFPINFDRAQMLLIHLWALGLGAGSISYLWKNRDAFRD